MTSFPTVIDLQAERAKRARARTDENGNASKFEPLRPFTAGDRLVVIAPRIFLQAAVERAVLNTLNHQ